MTATIYTAKVIGTDPKTDLALVKVDGKNIFPYEGRRHQTDRMAKRPELARPLV
jgi:serine protease Do